MKAAFITHSPVFTDWLRRQYPDVEVWQEAQDGWKTYDLILLAAYYKTERGFFQILTLWRKYLESKQSSHHKVRLGLIGWVSGSKAWSNYVSLFDPPPDISIWAEGLSPVSMREPGSYPALPHEDILIPISRMMKSHGVPFQEKLDRVLREVSRLENDVRKVAAGMSESILNGQQGKQTQQEFEALEAAWVSHRSLFALMPEFPELKRVENLFQAWHKWAQDRILPVPALSQQISAYTSDVVGEITAFYNMERYEG